LVAPTPDAARPGVEEHRVTPVHLGTGAFAELVQWACGRLMPDAAEASAELVRHAGAVDHSIGLGYQVGGLEFHHDGSGRVDLAIHCNPRRTVFGPAIERPHWFDRLVAQTVDTESPHSVRWSPGAPMLASQHWLEFDQSPTGLMLAGIWQAILTDDAHTYETPAVLDSLARAFSVTPLDGDRLRRSTRLAHFIDHLGVPTQFGIMTGRAHRVKVFRRCDHTPEQATARFLAHADLIGCLDGTASPVEIAHTLHHDLGEFTTGINIDLDLDNDRFGSGVGIELQATALTGEGLAGSIVSALRNRFGLSRALVAQIEEIATGLPIGAQRRRSFGPFDPFMAPGLRNRVFVAHLNHLKVVLRPDRPPTAKTYVRLAVHQGLEPADDEHR